VLEEALESLALREVEVKDPILHVERGKCSFEGVHTNTMGIVGHTLLTSDPLHVGVQASVVVHYDRNLSLDIVPSLNPPKRGFPAQSYTLKRRDFHTMGWTSTPNVGM